MNDWQRSKTGLGRMGDDKVGDDYSNEGIYANMDGELDLMERQRRGRGRRRRPPGPAVGPMPPPPPPPIMFDDNEEEDMMFDGGNYWINPTNTLDRYPADDNMRMMNENEGMMLAPGRRRRSRNGREGRLRRRNGRRDVMMDEYDEYDDDIDFFDDDDNEMMEYPGEYGIPPPTRSR